MDNGSTFGFGVAAIFDGDQLRFLNRINLLNRCGVPGVELYELSILSNYLRGKVSKLVYLVREGVPFLARGKYANGVAATKLVAVDLKLVGMTALV